MSSDHNLSPAEQAANFATMRHIERVRNLLNYCVADLLRRGAEHDQTKLAPPEVGPFTELTPRLATSTFDSPEYEEFKKQLGPALAHHYAHNAHHPEHHKEGVDDMTLLDLLEMFVDWKAASERHHDGNILRSVERNSARYKFSQQLTRIFENTAKAFANA